jgi:hypothetical protein
MAPATWFYVDLSGELVQQQSQLSPRQLPIVIVGRCNSGMARQLAS